MGRSVQVLQVALVPTSSVVRHVGRGQVSGIGSDDWQSYFVLGPTFYLGPAATTNLIRFDIGSFGPGVKECQSNDVPLNQSICRQEDAPAEGATDAYVSTAPTPRMFSLALAAAVRCGRRRGESIGEGGVTLRWRTLLATDP